jgi:hypothetical protein
MLSVDSKWPLKESMPCVDYRRVKPILKSDRSLLSQSRLKTRVLGTDVGPKEDEQELTCHRSG